MKLRIEIDLDNDAFYGTLLESEISRILYGLAHRFTNSGVPSDCPIVDVNGATVGKAELIEGKE